MITQSHIFTRVLRIITACFRLIRFIVKTSVPTPPTPLPRPSECSARRATSLAWAASNYLFQRKTEETRKCKITSLSRDNISWSGILSALQAILTLVLLTLF